MANNCADLSIRTIEGKKSVPIGSPDGSGAEELVAAVRAGLDTLHAKLLTEVRGTVDSGRTGYGARQGGQGMERGVTEAGYGAKQCTGRGTTKSGYGSRQGQDRVGRTGFSRSFQPIAVLTYG